LELDQAVQASLQATSEIVEAGIAEAQNATTTVMHDSVAQIRDIAEEHRTYLNEAARQTLDDVRGTHEAGARLLRESTWKAVETLHEATSRSDAMVEEAVKGVVRTTSEIVASAEERASRTAHREARKAADEAATEAAQSFRSASEEFAMSADQARAEMESRVVALRSSIGEEMQRIASEAQRSAAAAALRAESAAGIAREEAAKGAVSRTAQEASAQAAEESALFAREAASSLDRDAAARLAQETAARAAREAAEASQEVAIAAQAAIERSLEESAALREERDSNNRNLAAATQLLQEAVKQVGDMVWQHSVSAAAFRNDQEELLKGAHEAVNSVRGLARTAQAASAAAQRDAARLLTEAKVQGVAEADKAQTGSHEAEVEEGAPSVDLRLEDDSPEEQTGPAKSYMGPTPWEELEIEMASDRPDDLGELWTVPEYFEEDHLVGPDGVDDDAPLLGRIWTKLRHKVE
jgi:hypothetical protein